MKNIFLIFLFLNLGLVLNAQEIENSRFKLVSAEVEEIVQLQTNPVNTQQIDIRIYTAGDKREISQKIAESLTIHRGRAIHDINVSGLTKGIYHFVIYEDGKRLFRNKIIKR